MAREYRKQVLGAPETEEQQSGEVVPAPVIRDADAYDLELLRAALTMLRDVGVVSFDGMIGGEAMKATLAPRRDPPPTLDESRQRAAKAERDLRHVRRREVLRHG